MEGMRFVPRLAVVIWLTNRWDKYQDIPYEPYNPEMLRLTSTDQRFIHKTSPNSLFDRLIIVSPIRLHKSASQTRHTCAIITAVPENNLTWLCVSMATMPMPVTVSQFLSTYIITTTDCSTKAAEISGENGLQPRRTQCFRLYIMC